MMNSKKLVITFSVLICALAALAAVLLIPEGKPQEAAAETVEKTDKVTVNIRAVGDNLIHSPIYNSCRTQDGFNFDGLYENIEKYIAGADIAAINQETIFVEEKSHFSGYPSFGTPCEVGESVARAGFNLVTHATNHTYDRGYGALMYTMDFWSEYDDVTMLGINASAQEQQSPDIWKKGDLSIAMLNFTYGLNGYRLPEDKPYLVNILDCSPEDGELVRKAEESADITVVFVHFGKEYTHVPTTEQKRDIEFLCENGADIIIGTHPHVVQPMTKHVSENGNEAVVFYSLGNFMSNQSGAEKILGAMAEVTITKENGVVRVEKHAMYPLVTHCSDGKYSVYMLADYTNELAAKNTRAAGLTVEKLHTLYNRIIDIEA